MKNKKFLIALNRIPGIGAEGIQRCLQRWPDLSELFATSCATLLKMGISESIASIISRYDMQQVEADLHWERQQENRHIITCEDSVYPSLLSEIYAAPPVLYAEGDIACLAYTKVAIVGSRRPSITGLNTACQFGEGLAEAGLCVVSGLAAGIDAQAHTGCLRVHGRTIAVMGTGITQIYPQQHRQLAAEIKKNGLILTEFSLNAPASARHFPQRNRIISGLSLATLIVEAAVKSGSLITARFALEQNREVMAIPGSIFNAQSQGCHQLLQQGASLVTSVKEVLRELRWEIMPLPSAPQRQSDHADPLLKMLGYELTSLEMFVERTGLTLDQAASFLTMMECQGVIQSVPGGYMRCT